MTYELLEMIIKYASSCLSLVVFLFTTILFIINKIKAKHRRIDAEEEAETLDAEYTLVNEIIPLAIKKAEDTPLIDGKTKKLLALSEILLNCNASNIDFELYKDFINEQIENLIEFSKTINKRKED